MCFFRTSSPFGFFSHLCACCPEKAVFHICIIFRVWPKENIIFSSKLDGVQSVDLVLGKANLLLIKYTE